MIGSTLQFVAKCLNENLCQRLQLHPSANKVQLSSIADPSGKLTIKDNNVLLVKLINIEPDTIANGSEPSVRITYSGRMESAPLYINLRIMLAAYFQPEQIQAGLDMLTMGLAYFQGKPMWNPQNTPDLPPSVNKLVFVMETLNYDQLNHVWGAIGTKYLPSAMYKVKMLVIDSHIIQANIPKVIQVAVKPDKI